MNAFRFFCGLSVFVPVYSNAKMCDIYRQKAYNCKDKSQKLYYLSKALEKNKRKDWPFLSSVYHHQGELFQTIKCHKEAIQSFRKALIYHSHNNIAREKMAFSYFALKQWQDVIDALNPIDVNIRKSSFFIMRGDAYLYEKNHDCALMDFFQSLILLPKEKKIDIIKKIIFCYFYQKKYKKIFLIVQKYDIFLKKDGWKNFICGLTFLFMYQKEKEKQQRNFLFSKHIKENMFMVNFKKKAQKAFYQARCLGFSLEKNTSWKEFPFLRKHLLFFLELYTAVDKKSSKVKEKEMFL